MDEELRQGLAVWLGRPLGVVVAGLVFAGCATVPSKVPDEATALRYACGWVKGDPRNRSPIPTNVPCGFTSASLKDGAWDVVNPPQPCAQMATCVGGGSGLLIDMRTGRIKHIYVGQ